VSKLCCPVCWDFFDILNGDDEDVRLEVCGRHDLLFMLHLPRWTPREILEKMIKHYRGYLRDELLQLRPNTIPTPGHKHSMSDSALSHASDSSDDSAISTANKLMDKKSPQ
jgi:hypothetical protein